MNQSPVSPHGAPVHGRANLPVQAADPLVGREADIEALHLALRAGTAVLIHGPAGIGKTALCAALAGGYAELPGGVLWMDVDRDSLRSLVTRGLRALGAEVPPLDGDLERASQVLHELLRETMPLVVLDGELPAQDLREFVRRCTSGVPVLLTQQTLVSGPWTPYAIGALSADDSRALLLARADGKLTDDDPAVKLLVSALAGHPLSLIIAARQVAIGCAPDAFLARIPNLPPGQKNRAIGAVMAGYRSLPAELQGMVMLVGTAPARGATAELLSDVSGARPEVLQERMAQLAAAGLVERRTVFGQPYYAVHELVQEFAQAFLRGKNRLNTMITRYLQGLPAYVRRNSAEPSAVCFDRLSAEIPNLMAGALFAAQQNRSDFVREIAVVLGAAGPNGFVATRRFEPELAWLHILLEHPSAASNGVLGDVPEAPAEPAEPPAEVAGAHSVVSPVAADVSVPAASVPEVSEVVGPAETGEAPAAQAADRATAEYEEAAQSFQADGDVSDELAAIEALAKLNLESANYEAVLAYLDRGTALAQDRDNPQREGEMLIILGDLQMDLERYEGAEAAYREAIAALRPVEAWLDIGLTLEKLGGVYLKLQRPEEALGVWQQALPIFEHQGRTDLVRKVLNRLGDVRQRQALWEQAHSYYLRALEAAQTLEDPWAQFVQLSKLGYLMEIGGNPAGATIYYRRALHLAFGLDDVEQLARTLMALGRMLIDDTAQLNRALQLLEAANALLPDDSEAQRLLRRAKTRHDRLIRAGITVPLSEDSAEDYARRAFSEPDPVF